MTVEYRTLAAFPGYRFGDDGSVWTRRPIGRPREGASYPWRRLCGSPSHNGYLQIGLVDANGRNRNCRVNRLILTAFSGPPPSRRHVAMHDPDHTRTNNRSDNLRWGTTLENNGQTKATGRSAFGERNGNRKLTESQVIEIHRLVNQRIMSRREIATMFHIDLCTVKFIRSGRLWGYLQHHKVASDNLSRRIRQQEAMADG